MAHHCSARGNQVPPARILDESVTHYAGCAILFNKDTVHLDIKVSSIYLHDTWNGQHQFVNEGQSRWVSHAVISPCFIRKVTAQRQFFTMMSLHMHKHFAKKRGIGKKLLLTVRTVMLQEHADMVAGDFNGAAWRRQSRSDPRLLALMMWWQEACQVNGRTCANHLVLKENGQVRTHGAFTVSFDMPERDTAIGRNRLWPNRLWPKLRF